MSVLPENQLTFHSLYDSPLVSVSDYRCSAPHGGPAGEEHTPNNSIVLMRHGTFRKHLGGRSLTADVNQAVFFSRGSSYRISHPAAYGDRGTVFSPAPRVLKDIIRELDPSIEDHPEQPFPFAIGPCVTTVFWRHRELVQALEAAASVPLEHLWADLTALQIVADVLDAAFAQHGLPRNRRRNGTDVDHAERVESAKTYLASRMSERITLDEVARAVYTSPFHLARVFRQHTGVPIHRYLTRLRLRASLEQLAAGANDLTRLGLELGFSSHSHFSDSFHREFGRTPSEVRRNTSSLAFREMSKSLEV